MTPAMTPRILSTESTVQMSQSRTIAVLMKGREIVPSAEKQRGSAYQPSTSQRKRLRSYSIVQRRPYTATCAAGLPQPIRIGELVRWRWVDVEKAIESLEGGDDSHADHDDPYLAGIDNGAPEKLAIELPAYVNCVRVKGRPYYYYQPHRGTKHAAKAVRLPDDPRLPEFWTAYHKIAGEPEPKLNPRSFEHAIEAYKVSPEFTSLAVGTRLFYERYLETIRGAWGSLEVHGLLPAHVLKLRDKHQDRPATANAIIRTLSALISWSVPRGYRTDNPCQHVRKLAIGEGWEPWPWEMIALVRQHGPAWMWQAVALALYTGQRQGDVLEMSWAAVKDGWLEVRQERRDTPYHPSAPRVASGHLGKHAGNVQVYASSPPRGATPWTKGGFKASWRKALRGPLAAIRDTGLVFHGLRKSAVVTLLEAG